MTHGSLFSGIGGFDLAAEWMGWDNIFHCEWNEFGQRVLKHYWPNATSYHDITKTDFTIHRGAIDILTGGFPCQPYSMAGKRLGKEDERHLWPSMLRAIREIQPTWVVGENVFGLVNWNGGLVFNEVQADLEAEGYEVQPYVLPACAVNAPHRRDRVWFVAYSDKSSAEYAIQTRWNLPTSQSCNETTPHPNGNGQHRCNGNDEEQPSKRGLDAQRDPLPGNGDGNAPDSESAGNRKLKTTNKGKQNRFDNNNGETWDAADTASCGRGQIGWQRESRFLNETAKIGNWHNFPTQSPICNGDDGLSARLDSITFSKWRNESIKAGGNAIVPQVVYQIFKAIQQYNNGQFNK